MANVVNKADPSIYKRSVNTPDYSTDEWLINPPSFKTLVDSVPSKYWKIVGNDISEMTAPEKAVVDAAEQSADETAQKENAKDGYNTTQAEMRLLRAIVEVLLDELNTLRTLHSLSDRTMAQARKAIRNKIDGG